MDYFIAIIIVFVNTTATKHSLCRSRGPSAAPWVATADHSTRIFEIGTGFTPDAIPDPTLPFYSGLRPHCKLTLWWRGWCSDWEVEPGPRY